MKYVIIFFISVVFFSSCKSELTAEDRVEIALEKSGANRENLEAVLRHCEGDSLKILCAQTIIAQMPLFYHFRPDDLKGYYEFFRLFSKGKFTPEEVSQRVKNRYGDFNLNSCDIKRDIESVDSILLIENIEYAVKCYREMPWGKNVSLEDFIEYVLPYKIEDEEPSRWRKKVYEGFIHLFDGKNIEDPIDAAQIVLDSISKGHIYFTNMYPSGPHLGERNLRWRSGGCRDYSDYAAYIMRGLGIPCAVDFMPMRGDNNSAHSWNVIIGSGHKEKMFEFPTRDMKELKDFWCRKGKVYRQTYTINDSLYNDIRRDGNDSYPPSFENPRIKDVTAVYADTMNRSAIFPVDKYLYRDIDKDKPVFLCLSCRRNWIPVAWSWVENDTLTYEDVDGYVVFGLAQYVKGKQKIVSDPIFVDKYNLSIKLFEPEEKIDTVTLYYKYHLYNETHINGMKGSYFEASNNPDFSQSDTLWVLNEPITRLYNTKILDNPKKYKYFRYYSNPWTFGNIAEIAVFENATDTIRTMGEIIGLPGAGTEEETKARWAKAFDGDPYASFNHTQGVGAWVGLKFDKPTKIEKISFAPRNLDNFIRKGDIYELFFFKNHSWQSAGEKTATCDSIQFCVPRGSLMYLKNHTRGVDERIFEMTDWGQTFR